MKKTTIHIGLVIASLVVAFLCFKKENIYFFIANVFSNIDFEGPSYLFAFILAFSVFCVIVPFFVIGLIMELYSFLFRNKDKKAFRANEKIKNPNKSKGASHIITSLFNVAFIISSFFIMALIPIHVEAGHVVKFAFSIIFTYFAVFIAQSILFKIIKSQVEKVARAIKNKRAWR